MRNCIYTLLLLMLATLSATAANYFTIEGAVNDTLLINPVFLGNGIRLSVRAHFDGRVDQWTVTVNYPVTCPEKSSDRNLEVINVQPGNGMNRPFVNKEGNDSVYVAPLTVSSGNDIISSIITKFGYWDNNEDGIYDPYGTIKWEAGDIDMFDINCFLNSDCTGDSITFDSFVDCTFDWRGGMTYGSGFKKVFLKVGYKLGDVNGDGRINISDVSTLQSYLLNNESLDQYQLDAADIDRNGVVNIQDSAHLIYMLMQSGEINGVDLEVDI